MTLRFSEDNDLRCVGVVESSISPVSPRQSRNNILQRVSFSELSDAIHCLHPATRTHHRHSTRAYLRTSLATRLKSSTTPTNTHVLTAPPKKPKQRTPTT